jgi:hypothetical protein
LPTTQEEMQHMIREETPEFLTNVQNYMIKEIKNILGYSDQYVEKMERQKNEKIMKKYKKTWQY